MPVLATQEVTPLLDMTTGYIDRGLRVGDTAVVLRELPSDNPDGNPLTQLLVGVVRVVPVVDETVHDAVRIPRTFHLGGVELVQQDTQTVSVPYADLILLPAKGNFSIWRQPRISHAEPAVTDEGNWHQPQLSLY